MGTSYTSVDYDPFSSKTNGPSFVPVDHDPFGTEEPKPSYLGAAKTGLKEGIAGAAGFYSKLLPKPLDYPLEKVKEYFTPSEEETRSANESGIVGQVIRGAAGLPGAAVKYGPAIAAGTAVAGPIAGPALAMGGVEAIDAPKGEELRRGLEGAVIGGVMGPLKGVTKAIPGGSKVLFQGLPWYGRAGVGAGMFGGQALQENLEQGQPVGEAAKRSIAPAIIGAGLLGHGKRLPVGKGGVIPLPEIAARGGLGGDYDVAGEYRPREAGMEGLTEPLGPSNQRLLPPGSQVPQDFTLVNPSGNPITSLAALRRRANEPLPVSEAGVTPDTGSPPPGLEPSPAPGPAPIQFPNVPGRYRPYYSELKDIVEKGQPGGLVFGNEPGKGSHQVSGYSGSYPPLLTEGGYTKEKMLDVINRLETGQELKSETKKWKGKIVPNKEGIEQKEIAEGLKQYSRDRLRAEIQEQRDAVLKSDPTLSTVESTDALTKSVNDEIMPFREELKRRGYSDESIAEAERQASETFEGESSPETEKELFDFFKPEPEPAAGGTPEPPAVSPEPKPEPVSRVDLEAERKRLGDDEFMRQAGAMKFGDKGFELAQKIAEEQAGGQQTGVESPALQKLHENQARAKGLDIASETEAKKYFNDLRKIVPETFTDPNQQKLRLDLIDSAENAFYQKDFKAATALSEQALGEIHSEEVARNTAEQLKNLPEGAGKQVQAQLSTGEAPQIPLTREQAQVHADAYLKELPNSPPLDVVSSAKEIPERLRGQLSENLQNGIKGVYDPTSGKMFLVGENLADQADVIRTLNHEAISHYGTEAYLEFIKGDTGGNKFFSQIIQKYGKEGLKDIAEKRGLDLNKWEDRMTAAKEKYAEMTQTGEDPGFLQKVYAWVREKINKLSGGRITITDAEIQKVWRNARESMVTGETRKAEMDVARKVEAFRSQVRNISAVYQAKEPQFSISLKETGEKFYEEDLIPKVALIKGTFGQTVKGFVNLLAPTYHVSRDIRDVIMKMKGDKERNITYFVLDKTNERVLRGFERMSQEERIQFIDKLKTGQNQGSVLLNQVGSFVRQLDEAIGKKYLPDDPSGAPNKNWLDNHFRVSWKKIPRGSDALVKELEGEITDLKGKAASDANVEKIGALEAQIDWIKNGGEGQEGWKNWFSRRPLEGSKGYFKQHMLENMSEGIKYGGEPMSYNPMKLLELHYADVLKYTSAQNMWKALGDMGERVFVKSGEKPPGQGFVRLNDRLAKEYFKAPSGFEQKGEWWVREDPGRLLNNYLSRDLFRENPLGKGLMYWKNISTAMELALSPFHLSFESLEEVGSQVGFGIRKIVNQGKLLEGLQDIAKAPWSPYLTAKEGGSIFRYIADPKEFVKTFRGEEFMKKYPNAQELVNLLFDAGGKVGQHEDYRIRAIQTLKENIASKNYIGAGMRSIPAFNEMIMKPLFETYIPRLKLGRFIKEVQNELITREADILSGKKTRPEIAREVWKTVEDRFGEMNFDNLFWDRTLKTSLQFLVRSVTWKLGNIDMFGKAVTGQSKELISSIREGRMPKLTPEMGWAWGMMATTAALASVVQYAYTGKWPEEAKDFVYPKIDDEGNRASLPTYFRDAFSLGHSPTRYVWSSTAGWLGRLEDVLTNKDFYGQRIHDPESNIVTQRIDDLIHMMPLPFSVQSFKQSQEKGLGISRNILGFAGFTKAPYWIEKSDAQQLATELAAAQIPGGGMSKEQRQRTDLVKQYAREFQDATRKGGPTDEVMSKLTADLSAGKLNQVDLQRFKQRAMKESLEFTINRLSLREALQVWEKATPEERAKIAPYIMRKYRTSRSQEEREAALPKIQEIQGGL